MLRFSSRSTLTSFSRCRTHVLPTSVHTGATDSASSASALRRASAARPGRRVIPKAAICAWPKRSEASSSNSSSRSFGLTLGSRLDQLELDAELRRGGGRRAASPRPTATSPSPCMPSRSVASYSWMVFTAFPSKRGRRDGRHRRSACAPQGRARRPRPEFALRASKGVRLTPSRAPGTATTSSHSSRWRLAAPVEGVLERRLQLAGDRAGSPGADRVVVDLAHRHQLRRRPGQEHLVGEIQLGARDVAFEHLVALSSRASVITERDG